MNGSREKLSLSAHTDLVGVHDGLAANIIKETAHNNEAIPGISPSTHLVETLNAMSIEVIGLFGQVDLFFKPT